MTGWKISSDVFTRQVPLYEIAPATCMSVHALQYTCYRFLICTVLSSSGGYTIHAHEAATGFNETLTVPVVSRCNSSSHYHHRRHHQLVRCGVMWTEASDDNFPPLLSSLAVYCLSVLNLPARRKIIFRLKWSKQTWLSPKRSWALLITACSISLPSHVAHFITADCLWDASN